MHHAVVTDIEKVIIDLIAEVKDVDPQSFNFSLDSNFIEETNMNSFEIVAFVVKLESTLNISFGNNPQDFDSLINWSKFLTNLNDKVNYKKEIV